MAEPTSSAPAAPAAPAAPQASAPAPAGIDPSTAGRTLREAREARKAALRTEAAPADPKATTSASAGAPSTSPARATGSTPAPADGSTPSSAQADPADAEIQALVAENRRIAKERTALETRAAAVKDVEELAPRVRQADELAKKGDMMGAVRAAFGHHGPEFMKGLFWELLKANPEADEATVDPEKLWDQKYEARKQAEKDAAEAQRHAEEQKVTERYSKVDADVDHPGFSRVVQGLETLKGIPRDKIPETVESYGNYVVSVGKNLNANPGKYKAIERLGVSSLSVVLKCEEMRVSPARKGVPPNTAEVLQAIEDELNGVARDLAGTSAPAAPARPAVPTLSNSWRQIAGSPPAEVTADAPKTLDEIRAARKRTLLGQTA